MVHTLGTAGLCAMLGACQVISLQEDYAQHPPVAITAIELSGTSDLELTLQFQQPVDVRVLISTNPAMEHVECARLAGEQGGARTWIDTGAAARPGVRYYRLRVDTGTGPWLSSEEWAVFTQAREAGARYLVSVPVELGAENRLDGMLGRQLALGLHAGQSTNDADSIQYVDASGKWRTTYLLAKADGLSQWTDVQSGKACEAVIEPGRALWIQRGSGAGDSGSHGLLWGRTFTRPYPVQFRSDAARATPFGLPWSRPLAHRRAEVAVHGAITDPLGFGSVGSPGKTSDARQPDACGDQIWVWRDNEWQGFYWLMGHLGPAWDGRWWDNRARDFADFELEPGIGYYYRHRPNRWGGTDFVWAPPVYSKSVDN